MKTEQSPLKILCIGDLHGYVPKNAAKIVERENPDFIINTGDFCNADKSRALIFKNWNKLSGRSLADVVGKKKLKEIYSEEIKSSYAPIKFLTSLKIPVYTITGNNDFVKKDIKWLKEDIGLKEKSFEELIAKSKIKILNKKEIGKFQLLGKSGYFGFGDYNLKRREKDLKKLFENTKGRKNEKTIFVSHSPPYGILDIVGWKKSPMYKKHVGDVAYRKIIDKYKPALNICAHMHENQGIKRVGKTIVLNLGLAKEGLFLVSLDKTINIRKIYK